VEARHVQLVHRAATSIYDLLRDSEADILGAEMASDIAVVASLQACYYGRYSYHLEVSRALADAGIAHEMLAPRSLCPAKLAQYHAVVLPNTAVLSKEAYAALVEYERAGGTVIAFGEIGVLDARGGPGPAAGQTGPARYTEVPIDPEALARDNATVGREPDDTRHAGWARGQWSVRLKATIDGVVTAVEAAAGDAMTARKHGGPGVEISAMRKPGSDDLIVHAVNYGVDLSGEVAPARDVQISVALNAKRVAGVEWRALDGVHQSLQVRETGRRAEFVVPQLDIYGIAFVRLSDG
jgi:hypothetical protein